MHQSAFEHMAHCVKAYAPTDRPIRVVDLGSRNLRGRSQTHRPLLDNYDCEYIGVDISEGANVDVVMRKPYRLPVRSKSVDIVLSGQAFEHIPFFWVTMTEIARILKPNGHAFVIAPSRGHPHGSPDCWRFYPDSMRALAAWSGLELREASTDFPPRSGSTRRHNYAAIDAETYWGDTVGVFRKPARHRRVATSVVRRVTAMWGNRLRPVDPS